MAEYGYLPEDGGGQQVVDSSIPKDREEEVQQVVGSIPKDREEEVQQTKYGYLPDEDVNAVKVDPSDFIPLSETADLAEAREHWNYLGGWVSGLNQSASFNLAREGRALFDSDTLMNNDWLFGKFNYGDKPWTKEIEKGFNWVSVEEQLGVAPEVWDKMSHSARVKTLNDVTQKHIQDFYNPDVDSAAYMISQFTGMLTDPTVAVALRSPTAFASVGAVDASLYEHGTTGELSPTTPILGGTIGYGGGKLVQKIQQRSVKNKAASLLNDLQNEMVNVAAASRLTPPAVLNAAKKNLGLNDEIVDEALSAVDSKLSIPTRKNARVTLAERAEKEIRPGSLSEAGQFLDNIIEPISEGIKRISPRIYGKIKQIERQHFDQAHKYATMVDPFLSKAFSKYKPKGGGQGSKFLNANQQDELYHMMLNASSKKEEAAISTFIRKKGGKELYRDYRMYREAMDGIYNERVLVGNSKLQKVVGYSPRRISNYHMWYNGARADQKLEVNKLLEGFANKRNKSVDQLTEKEFNKVVTRYLASPKGKEKTFQNATSAKSRTKEKITKGQVKIYEDPWHATHKYIKESMEEVQRYKLFGSKNIDELGDVEKTVSNYVAQEMKAGRITDVNVGALKEYLNARFIMGPKMMNEFLRKSKDVGYMTLLGHSSNAIRQLGDLTLSAYMNGLRNTMRGVYGTITKKMMTPKEMGLLDNIAEEFASDTSTKRAVDFSFKYSGFRSVDALGKGALVNSTLIKAGKQVMTGKGRTEFMNKWSSILGPEDAAQAMEDFAKYTKGKGEITPLMKDIGFMRLSDIQPISLMEMPKAYLNNPNGRMLYMLKSFTIKHINLMRQESFKEIRRGNVAKGIKNLGVLTTFFTLGNMGADKIIDLVLNKDTKLEDTFYANLWRSTGIMSKYDIDQMARDGDIYDWAVGLAVPPFDPLTKGATESVQIASNVAQGKKWSSGLKHPGQDIYVNIPIIGRLMKAWLD